MYVSGEAIAHIYYVELVDRSNIVYMIRAREPNYRFISWCGLEIVCPFQCSLDSNLYYEVLITLDCI